MNYSKLKLENYASGGKLPPNFKVIGEELDNYIKSTYLGKSIAIRALSSSEHLGFSKAELIEIIKRDGTDRYDPDRKGDRYENVENKHIDLFALSVDPVSEESVMFEHMLNSFWHWPLKTRGHPVEIDIIIVYDLEQLEEVEHRYEGRDEVKRDGYIFRNPNKKVSAVLGILEIV